MAADGPRELEKWLRIGWRWTRRLTKAAAAAYLVLLPVLIMAVFPLIGETNVMSAFLLYLPRALWLLLGFLAVAVLLILRSRWMALTGLVITLLMIVPVFGLRFSSPEEAVDGRPVLRLASYNRGQHMNQSLQPFIQETAPDIVLMQDAARRAKNYQEAEAYREFKSIEGLGEFLILSRYQIVESELISPPHDLPGDRKKRRKKKQRDLAPEPPRPIAARFVIELPGTGQVAVYNVHTLTVRNRLKGYLRGRCLLGVIGIPGTPLAEKRRAEETYWRLRQEQLDALGERIAADPLPCVIAGDFNVPSGGRAYRSLCARWQEAHREVGSGSGYSFPGTTRNPLSLGGPWMRLDHIFYDQQWRALESVTEKKRKSQHRAVFAVLELVTPKAPAADSGR